MDKDRLAPMVAWANAHIAAHPRPDFTVFARDRPQLQRWYVVPRNDVRNVYLHRFLASDEDRAPHDHRGDNVSWVIDGEYDEHVFGVEGVLSRVERRRAGDVVSRAATLLHRVELVDDRPALSLFFIGPIVRDWGFRCPDRWMSYEEFISVVPGGNAVGRGCGD